MKKDLVFPQDFVTAYAFYDRGCNLKNEESCMNMAAAFANGSGVTQDLGTAKTYFRKACNIGAIHGCEHFEELRQQGY